MKRKVDWFSRGRDAYTAGRPCFIDDARISSTDRQAWYAGWRRQHDLNTNPAEAEARAEAIKGLQQILDSL